MTNFIFKSASGLIKNSPINNSELDKQLKAVLLQNRLLRQDLVDVKLMLNKLLVDKHLQMEVDNYFDRQEAHDAGSSE